MIIFAIRVIRFPKFRKFSNSQKFSPAEVASFKVFLAPYKKAGKGGPRQKVGIGW